MKTRTMKPRSSIAVPRIIQRRFPQVTKCIDAPKTIVVEVTEADNSDGASADFEQCALARAACRQQHADHALVSKRVIYTIKGHTAIRYGASERVRQEITSFDRHHDFAPGEYALRPTRPSDRLGARPYTPRDTRPRHDTALQRWVRSPRVRDLNMAEAAEAAATSTKKTRRK